VLFVVGFALLALGAVTFMVQVARDHQGAYAVLIYLAFATSYVVSIGAFAILVSSLETRALNAGVRRAFQLLALAFVLTALGSAFAVVRYRQQHISRYVGPSVIALIGELIVAAGYWQWSKTRAR
jgi:uncharacterized membrane protein YidH (DUF202 family)